MRGAAYSLWDVIYLVECGARRRSDFLPRTGQAGWFRRARPRTARSGSVGRTATALVAVVCGLLFAALVLASGWMVVAPSSFEAALATAGLGSPRSFLSLLLCVLGVAGVLAGALAGVGAAFRPWEIVARRVRPARRWRLWGYQAAAAGRGPPDFLDVLGREHAARVEFWRRRLRASPRASSAFVYLTFDPLVHQLCICIGLAYMLVWWVPAAFGAAPAASPGPWLSCYAPVLTWTPLALGFARRRSAARRLRRTLEHSRCPDCGYDLSDLPPALPRDKVPGGGPARCPECGSVWQLVPPPIDVD